MLSDRISVHISSFLTVIDFHRLHCLQLKKATTANTRANNHCFLNLFTVRKKTLKTSILNTFQQKLLPEIIISVYFTQLIPLCSCIFTGQCLCKLYIK